MLLWAYFASYYREFHLQQKQFEKKTTQNELDSVVKMLLRKNET